MKKFSLILGFCVFFGSAYSQFEDALEINYGRLNPNFGLNISQFLTKYDYPFEEYEVQTEDGYILGLHRIPYGRNGTFKDDKKPVVFLMHGLVSCSMDWVNMGPNKSLALLFADLGYDVWLGNSRGNTWSRKHVTLDPLNKTFWEYSFHEIGYYDIPAIVDFILNKTQVENISYVGHSQGTSSFFAMATTRPEYNKKINIMTALSPVVFMENMTHPVVEFFSQPQNLFLLDMAVNYMKMYELVPHYDFLNKLAGTFCDSENEYFYICLNIFYLIGGRDESQLDKEMLPVIASNSPAGVSYQEVRHYLQEKRSGYFRQYDHGIVGNMKKYGQMHPPSYNLSLADVPVAAFYSSNDLFAAECNVKKLLEELPNLNHVKRIDWPQFTHLDFLWAKDAVTLVYNDVIDVVNQYNNKTRA